MTQDLAPSVRPSGDASRQADGWWRSAVIYQVYVRSFADSDGDGIGDLRGIRQRLPYLAGLGVDALWLTPFYASPQADGGYDVADYRAVDPLFGDLSDADDLVREAHRLGLRVIVDIVPNHTSDQHAWFRAALADRPEGAARERYHFRPGRGASGELPPNDWESVFGGPAWTRTTDADGTPGEWYLHLFAPEQPDLNWDNAEVRAEFESVLRFWLDLGVDGFRIDVAHGMVKAPGLPDIGRTEQAKLIGAQVLPFFDQDGVHEIHRGWRRLLDSYPGERIGVAEAWAPTAERLALYVRPDELHQAFNFQFLTCDWGAEPMREVIDESLAATLSVGAPTTWVLSNHDVVRHATRYGAGDGELGLRRARAAALLMLALPGSVYVYQGEELGLPEVTDLPDEVRQDPAFFRGDGQDGTRDGCRVPLPWSGEAAPFGFGTGGSWLPQPRAWAALSVEAQSGDPRSTLELYRSALALRRELPGLGDGAMTWLDAPEGVLAFSRPGFVCTLNARDGEVTLPVPGRPVLATDDLAALEFSGGTVRIPANSCVWWAV
ncbi:glycoside hydrolase family 13 protein [Streptomyces griseocarneus]|uniref:glycoside hydrolase family 13 protein n=1 Tax=Streptomyces griseocarneus TaxID=51201 RepID=UPI00167C96C5|nr:glycoside hydrolase family 13 protein [Streptomyces griseocarneus]MBZ6472095.1 glycoside hydrolase family 13 protein [Streptomyces griseocarneus]GHG73842.1 alpha-glucosidase [Streptomyces griseocarneus]